MGGFQRSEIKISLSNKKSNIKSFKLSNDSCARWILCDDKLYESVLEHFQTCHIFLTSSPQWNDIFIKLIFIYIARDFFVVVVFNCLLLYIFNNNLCLLQGSLNILDRSSAYIFFCKEFTNLLYIGNLNNLLSMKYACILDSSQKTFKLKVFKWCLLPNFYSSFENLFRIIISKIRIIFPAYNLHAFFSKL